MGEIIRRTYGKKESWKFCKAIKRGEMLVAMERERPDKQPKNKKERVPDKQADNKKKTPPLNTQPT